MEDTAEHTIFHCPHWTNHREVINGRFPLPEDVYDVMCGPIDWPALDANIQTASKSARNSFVNIIDVILSSKEVDDREAEKHRGIHERNYQADGF
jgi:hypothetical protein